MNARPSKKLRAFHLTLAANTLVFGLAFVLTLAKHVDTATLTLVWGAVGTFNLASWGGYAIYTGGQSAVDAVARRAGGVPTQP